MRNDHCVRVLMITGAVLFLCTAPLIAMEKSCAAGPGPADTDRGMKRERSFARNQDQALGLTEEQRAKMKTIREASMAQQEAMRKELRAKYEALRQELDAEKPDRARAVAIVKEMGVLEERKGLDRVDMVLKIREVLTPEQYQKLQSFRKDKKRSKGPRG